MSRYTELRHAGYYQDGLSDADRKKIEKEVDRGNPRTETPAESTVIQPPTMEAPSPKAAAKKK